MEFIEDEWAGLVFCDADVYTIRQWCVDNIEDPDNNTSIDNYGEMCGLHLKHEKDYVLAQLRWR